MVWAVAVSRDGKWVVTGSEDGTARVWDAVSGRELRKLTGHSDQVWSVAVTPDGHTVYVANTVSGTVTPIATATNVPGVPIKVGSGPDGVAITPDGHAVYVANAGSGTVTPIATATNTPAAAIKVGLLPRGAGITP